MKTREDYIQLLSSKIEDLKTDYGIKSLRIFGSVSRNEHTESSDVDICVEMEPKLLMIVRLKRFLESLLQTSVDLVRLHKYMNPNLLQEIEKDGIYIIR